MANMTELDDALHRFHLCGFEYADETPNYGPMAVEALAALGHGALITGLLDVYIPRLPPLALGKPLEDAERGATLGRFDRVGDWLATYEQDLMKSDVPSVVGSALGVLAKGAGGAAIHGMIRVAHALRSLEAEENEHRVRELAFGLAYWSGRYCVPTLADTSSVEHAQGRAGDGDVLDRISLRGAERYLASPEARSIFMMGVLAPNALRILAPHLAPEDMESGLRGVLAACPPAVSGAGPLTEDSEVARCAASVDEVRYRGACSMHEHAIVMTEACISEDAANPHSTLRLAAADAALRLSPPGYQEWR